MCRFGLTLSAFFVQFFMSGLKGRTDTYWNLIGTGVRCVRSGGRGLACSTEFPGRFFCRS